MRISIVGPDSLLERHSLGLQEGERILILSLPVYAVITNLKIVFYPKYLDKTNFSLTNNMSDIYFCQTFIVRGVHIHGLL